MLRVISTLSALVLGGMLAVTQATAQDYPTKQPIKIVVSFNAGGLTDLLARITAKYLSKRLGQSVVVENRVGASGAVGAAYVAAAAPDGYTLMLSAPEVAVLPATRSDLQFNSQDFTYLVRPFTTQPIVVAGPHLPVASWDELIKYMKDNPGKVRYGTPGVGHWVHLESVAFENVMGIKGTHIPYPGIAPVYTDLLAGNVDITLAASPPFPDTLKVLATLASKRHPAYPNAPTLAELGVNGLDYSVWFGFEAPAGLPKQIGDRLITELTAVFKDPAAIAQFQTSAKIVPDTDMFAGDAFRDAVLAETTKWKTIAEREKISLQQ
jgi:tripartite-type tricarboxylate transporter receptor subunit TctC